MITPYRNKLISLTLRPHITISTSHVTFRTDFKNQNHFVTSRQNLNSWLQANKQQAIKIRTKWRCVNFLLNELMTLTNGIRACVVLTNRSVTLIDYLVFDWFISRTSMWPNSGESYGNWKAYESSSFRGGERGGFHASDYDNLFSESQKRHCLKQMEN